jgi:hypothetical protein
MTGKRGVWLMFVMSLVMSLILSAAMVDSANARCCQRKENATSGCDGASQQGCLSGSSQNIFFPDPCECVSDECVDPTNNNAACGGNGGPPGVGGGGPTGAPVASAWGLGALVLGMLGLAGYTLRRRSAAG